MSEVSDEAATERAANDPLRGHPSSRLPDAERVVALSAPPPQISPLADIGHVNLTVTSLERSLSFYRDVIGLHVTQRDSQSVFLAAGGYHHHVALNIWGAGGSAIRLSEHRAGLHHFALRLPDVRALCEVVLRVMRAKHALLGATDHGVNLAVYLADPDGNGIELMVDRPRSEWPTRADGEIAIGFAPLDLQCLLEQTLESEP